MKPFAYVRATGVAEAVAAHGGRPGSRYLAGGTNLVDLMKLGVEVPDTLVDLTGLPAERHGVPLVLIPHQFEQLLNARCVAARGAGLILEERLLGKPLGAARLRQALETVLRESRYRDAARALQQAVRATGGYRQAADEIQAYLARP